MSASTASSAGRFAWMSEISAYRITAAPRMVIDARQAQSRRFAAVAAHNDSRLGTRALKFLGASHVARHLTARHRLEAKAWEVVLGRRGQEVECTKPGRFC